MHELSIALSIVEMAEEEASRRGSRVTAVHLKLGPLAGVEKDALLGSFELAVEGTLLEGARLVVEDAPIRAHCPNCRELRPLPSPQFLRCPACGAPTPDVVQGAELLVTALELSDDAAPRLTGVSATST